MSYELIFTPVAERDLERVPPALLEAVEAHLARLASAPTQGTRPSAFPYPPSCMLYQFQQPLDGGNTYAFTVLFRYAQNETRLFILGIGHGELLTPPAGEEAP